MNIQQHSLRINYSDTREKYLYKNRWKINTILSWISINSTLALSECACWTTVARNEYPNCNCESVRRSVQNRHTVAMTTLTQVDSSLGIIWRILIIFSIQRNWKTEQIYVFSFDFIIVEFLAIIRFMIGHIFNCYAVISMSVLVDHFRIISGLWIGNLDIGLHWLPIISILQGTFENTMCNLQTPWTPGLAVLGPFSVFANLPTRRNFMMETTEIL